MRLGTNDVAADQDRIQSATERPLINRVNQTTANAFSALPIGNHKPPDFAEPVQFQDLLFSRVNPTGDFGCFHDKDDVLIPFENSREPLRHDSGADWITKSSA